MYRLRRIPAIRAATLLTLTAAIPYGLLLLTFGLFLSPTRVVTTSTVNGQVVAETTDMTGNAIVSLGVAWLVAVAAIWISIGLSCLLYNLIAGRLGGIDLELEPARPT